MGNVITINGIKTLIANEHAITLHIMQHIKSYIAANKNTDQTKEFGKTYGTN